MSEGTDAEIVRDRLLAQDVLQRAGSGLAKQFVDEGLEALDRILAVVEAARAHAESCQVLGTGSTLANLRETLAALSPNGKENG